MLAGGELAKAVDGVGLRDWVYGPWSRAVAYCHVHAFPNRRGAPQPLYAQGPAKEGARFTPKGGCDALYLADNPATAFAEVSALVLLPGGPTAVLVQPWVVVCVKGAVQAVLDLTDVAAKAFDTSAQEFAGPWAIFDSPPTQLLGQAVFDSGRIVGIQYPSAKPAGRVNLVVFPERLAGRGVLEAHDPHGHLVQRLE